MYLMVDAFQQKSFINNIIFNSLLFVYGRGTTASYSRLHDCQNRSLMEELQKESCFRGYHFYSSIWDPEIGEPVHVVGLSPLMNANDCCCCS